MFTMSENTRTRNDLSFVKFLGESWLLRYTYLKEHGSPSAHDATPSNRCASFQVYMLLHRTAMIRIRMIRRKVQRRASRPTSRILLPSGASVRNGLDNARHYSLNVQSWRKRSGAASHMRYSRLANRSCFTDVAPRRDTPDVGDESSQPRMHEGKTSSPAPLDLHRN